MAALRGARVRELALLALRSRVARALATPLVTPRTPDDYLALLGPMWSLDEVRARIVKIVREAPDVTSLLLEPTANWPPHSAGQHVLLTVDIGNIRHTRSFSLSRAPDRSSPLRITMKAHAYGRVSAWARDRARVGDVLTLSPAQGDFVLPSPVPRRLLFVSGGSGITPLVAMGQQLARDGYDGDLRWIHSERGDIPLESDLHAIIHALKHASLHVHRSAQHRLVGDRVKTWVPDWAEREAFVCGPRGLTELIDACYQEINRATQVHREDYQPRFVSRPARPSDPATVASDDATPGRLVFVRSGRETHAEPGVPLLVQAERAGLHPAHGCRRGICHTCKCRKLAGTVRNELTGKTHTEADQEIQLCIHSPLGDVSLEL